MLRYVLFVCLFVCLFFVSSFAMATEWITISAPEIAEVGTAVPVKVVLDKPLAANERLTVLANGEIAAQVTADDSTQLLEFSTRVRLVCHECTVSATIAVDGILEDFADAKVNVMAPELSPPQSGKARRHDDMRVNSKKNIIRLIVYPRTVNPRYLRLVEIRTSAGKIKINTTEYLSAQPHFKIKTAPYLKHIYESDIDLYW